MHFWFELSLGMRTGLDSGKTIQMCKLAWAFAARICEKFRWVRFHLLGWLTLKATAKIHSKKWLITSAAYSCLHYWVIQCKHKCQQCVLPPECFFPVLPKTPSRHTPSFLIFEKNKVWYSMRIAASRRYSWNIMPYLLFLKKRQKLKLSSAANYRWRYKG